MQLRCGREHGRQPPTVGPEICRLAAVHSPSKQLYCTVIDIASDIQFQGALIAAVDQEALARPPACNSPLRSASSSFHEQHGYYVQGVGEQTAVLPKNWRSRLVAVINENTNGVTGLCLEVHDLAISKIIAQRPKDIEFVQELARNEMIEKKAMLLRAEQTNLQEPMRRNIQTRIKYLFKA